MPAPTVSCHDGWTADRQRRFIAALTVLGSASGYQRRNRDDAASFADAWSIETVERRDRVSSEWSGRSGHRRRHAYAMAHGERSNDPFSACD